MRPRAHSCPRGTDETGVTRRSCYFFVVLLPVGIVAWVFGMCLGGAAGVILQGLSVAILAVLVVALLAQVRR